MSDPVSTLAEQWPLLTAVASLMGGGLAVAWKWYMKRESARDAKDARREEECVKRLQALEDRGRGEMQACINKNSNAMSANAESNRNVAGALDRLTRAIADRSDIRQPTPPEGLPHVHRTPRPL